VAKANEMGKTSERPFLTNDCSVAEIYEWLRKHEPAEGEDGEWLAQGAESVYHLYQEQLVEGEHVPEPLTQFQYACLLLLVGEIVPEAELEGFVSVLNALLVLPLPIQGMVRCDLKAGTFQLDERIEVTECTKEKTAFKLPADLIRQGRASA